MKVLKTKVKIFKEARIKTKYYIQVKKVRIIPEYLTETMQTKSQWVNIFKVLKEPSQHRILYPEKIYSKNESEIKIFVTKKKLRELTANMAALYKK